MGSDEQVVKVARVAETVCADSINQPLLGKKNLHQILSREICFFCPVFNGRLYRPRFNVAFSVVASARLIA